MADMLRLRLAVAVKEDGSGWTLLDDALFTRLANLQLSVTVGSGASDPADRRLRDRRRHRASPTSPSGSVLTVTAMDPTVLMHLDEKVKPWPNMKDSDVASAIFSDAATASRRWSTSTKWSRAGERPHADPARHRHPVPARSSPSATATSASSSSTTPARSRGTSTRRSHDGQPQGTLTVNMGAATNVNRFRARFDMLGPTTAKATTLDPDDASDQNGRRRPRRRRPTGWATTPHRPGRPAAHGAAQPARHGAGRRGRSATRRRSSTARAGRSSPRARSTRVAYGGRAAGEAAGDGARRRAASSAAATTSSACCTRSQATAATCSGSRCGATPPASTGSENVQDDDGLAG